MEVKFDLPGLPPSSNALFATIWKTKRRVKSREYVEFEKLIHAICLMTPNKPLLKSMKGRPYKLTIEIFDRTWLFKNGKPKRTDIDNRIKSVQDSICKAWGWDDSCCVEVTAKKCIGPVVATKVTFEFLSSDNLR